MIIFLLIKGLEEYPETFKLKLPKRKSVEDVEKIKTKKGNLIIQTQGNSTGNAITYFQGRVFNTLMHSLSCLMMKFHC